MRYAYPCRIVRDEEEARATGREAYTVTFPDVYGANTGAWSREDALALAPRSPRSSPRSLLDGLPDATGRQGSGR